MSNNIKILFLLSFLFYAVSNENSFLTRISIFNFGLDYTKFTRASELYRSISIIPLMVENEKVGLGFYITPFLKNKYDDYGHYVYNALNQSYLLNLRLRYVKDISKKINGFFDMAYGGKDVFKNSPADLGWLEFGIHYKINYSFRLFAGYKYTLYSNKEIDVDSFFINLTFGHSFLRK